MPPREPDGVDVRELIAGNPQLAEEVRGVVVPEAALRRYTEAVAALLAELSGVEALPEACEGLLVDVAEATRILRGRTVRLQPQHVYDLARRSPGLPAPFDVWAPLVESGLRLQEDRDKLSDALHDAVDERDRAIGCAVALEQELAHVDDLISRALFDVARDDVEADEAARELVARIRIGAPS